MITFQPAYFSLSSAQRHRRAERAIATLADCRACPRDCRVNRLDDKWAACKTGRYAIVSSHFAHRQEANDAVRVLRIRIHSDRWHHL